MDAVERQSLMAAIAYHLTHKTIDVVIIEEPPLPTFNLVDYIRQVNRVRTFTKVRSPYDKGGRAKNKGRSIIALMCRLQGMNPPCRS